MNHPSRQRSLFGDEPESPGTATTREESTAAPERGQGPAPPPESLKGKTVYVIDAHSLIYQVFHALPEMSSPQGEPVGAVYGFARDLFFLLESKKPDYLFCAFDMPGKTFRHDVYTEYKAHRPAMPDDLITQVQSIRRLIEALGIPGVGVESYEADDLLATIGRVTEELGGDCYLVTGDKDCRQLIRDRVKMYNIRKDTVIDRDTLREEWGIGPEQVPDYQGLVGDSTDNVPGVPLIGPKVARELLEKHATLEQVLDHAPEMAGGKRKQNLIDYREQALLSRDLATLDRNVPLEIDWEAARTGQIDRAGALELFREFGFRSLAEKIDALASPPEEAGIARQASYGIVDTAEALTSLVTDLGRQASFSLDLETTSIHPRRAKIVGYAISWEPDQAWYVPVRAPRGEVCLEAESTLETLRPVLENAAIEKIGQNLKYDMIVLRSAGVELAGVAFDTMVASYLLDAGARNHNLDDLAKTYLGHTTIKIDELIGTGKNQRRMDEVPVRQVADYAGEDALLPVLLKPPLAEKLAESGLGSLFGELELPLIDVLVEMEFNGIRVDCQRLAELSRRYGERIEQLEREIYELAGHEFNIGSPKQLQQLLFQELGLPVIKKTKTGASTDVEVLEELARVHPLPAKIMEYRQYAKLKSTYVDALPEMVFEETGRVHASFNQVVTATGRLSSSDPNLQNIPVRTEEGREIRSAFVPGQPGWLLLAADYSQIELRVLAHFSEDEHLCEAFARDEDIHARVASQIYGVGLDEVTSAMRRQAKAVNFGVIYGQSPFGLSKQLGIEQKEAAEFIDAYFGGYPGIERFLEKTLADCHRNGYVSTILGRRRAIRGIRTGAGRQRNLAERTAINTVIQGSAADLIKEAMIAIYRRLRRECSPARMLLQIHDELIFEVPAEHRDTLAALVAEEMTGVRQLKVPLKVDLKAGPNWADAHPWES